MINLFIFSANEIFIGNTFHQKFIRKYVINPFDNIDLNMNNDFYIVLENILFHG
jgi:hypothetical protein